jgi:hypothetical protein
MKVQTATKARPPKIAATHGLRQNTGQFSLASSEAAHRLAQRAFLMATLPPFSAGQKYVPTASAALDHSLGSSPERPE